MNLTKSFAYPTGLVDLTLHMWRPPTISFKHGIFIWYISRIQVRDGTWTTKVPKYGCKLSNEHILGTINKASNDRMSKAESIMLPLSW